MKEHDDAAQVDATRKDAARIDAAGVTRRRFLGGAAAAAGAFTIVPRHVLGGRGYQTPSETLNVAVIGVGGKGWSDMTSVMETERIAALCDVDFTYVARGRGRAETLSKLGDIPRYADYRELLATETDLDAAIVATPDHMHAFAGVAAMRKGLHLFCQKPLTRTVHEARLMRAVAKEMDVATQMGNQGTSSGGLRRSVEIVRSGAIGDVREVHVWTNRPGSYWKQAMHRPAEPDSIPPSLNWDLWLGASPERPYNRGLYAHFAWRGWWDFGTGALGDMACHTANLPFMALKLGYPTSIEAETSQRFPESGPAWSIIKFEYPAREGFPPCTLTWYDGGQLPPAELFEGIEPRGSGSLMVGSEGKLYSPDDYGQRSQLLPETDFEGFEAPEPTLPRTEGHYEEWIAACKGGAPAMSNFEYSGLLTESILLGNLAIRGGHRIEWDAENARASNCDFVDEFIKPESRAGHSLEA